MMTTIIITLFFLVANAAFSGVIWASIQPSQWLDRLLGWQKYLNKVGSKPGIWNEIRYKWLGGCEFCYCHFISVICFIGYAFFMAGNNLWFSIDNILLMIISNIVWYLSFVTIGTMLSFYNITKLMRSDTDRA